MDQEQSQIAGLFVDAFRHLGKKRPIPEIEVRFYPYAGLHHTIRLRSGRVFVRVSDIFRDAPAEVHRALAFILVSKLFSKRPPIVHDRIYRNYAMQPHVLRASDIARRRRGHKKVTSPKGRVYDLERIFDRLNRKYFDGGLQRPMLSWSQRKTHRILGHHDPIHETIVVSKTLDAADVPAWFVDYIVFHEMLHIKHPPRVVNGRRYYHTNGFRIEEQRFPYFEKAQEWLDRFVRMRRSPRTRAA